MIRRIPLQTLLLSLTIGLVGVESGLALDPGRLQKAKKNLEERMEARREAGWKPKSPLEQKLTLARVYQRQWERKQDRAAQRAAFENAKAEVYLELSKHFARVARRYWYYDRTVVRDPITGQIGVLVGPRRSVYYDPLALALAARWGNLAARSKGIGAAQQYRATTYYAKRIAHTQSRIAALEASLDGRAQVAQAK